MLFLFGKGGGEDMYRLNRLEVHSEHSFDDQSVLFKDPLTEKRISVIVPTYNVESYIRDFFKSILSQSYQNLEIIVVTDAPTDNSLYIAQQYARQDKRIKIIKNEQNLGVAKTLSRGYQAATGDFCATMSPDDTLDMFYFENLIKKYEETGSDVICARLLATQNNYYFSDGKDFVLYPFAAKIAALFYFYPALVRRKLIVENDIWNESMVERHWEDVIVRCKYAYYANHVSVATNAIRYYTIRSESLSHKPTPEQLQYQLLAEERCADFLKNVGIDDIHIKVVNGFKIEGAWDLRSWFCPIQLRKKHSHKFRQMISDFWKKLLTSRLK